MGDRRGVHGFDVPIALQVRDPQAAQAMGVDQALPIEKLLHRQSIALTGIVQADQAVAHRGDDLGLATDNPAHSVFWRETFDGQWLTCRTD